MTTRARAAIRATLPGAFEHHDGELPPGLRLVVVVLRPDRGHQAPQALALFAIGDAGPRAEALAVDLHLDARLGDEVVKPGRVAVRAPVGGHDDVALAVADIERLGLARLAAAPPGRRQVHTRAVVHACQSTGAPANARRR